MRRGIVVVVVLASGVAGAGAASAAPPIPVVALPSEARSDARLVLDATASRDDGRIVAVAWSLGDGAHAAGARVTHRYAAGRYRITLTVTDDTGDSASLERDLIVSDRPPAAPGLAIEGGADLTRTRRVTLTIAPPAGAAAVRLSNDRDLATSRVVPLAERLPWALDGGEDGERTVTARFVDAVGADVPGSLARARIVLDRTAPEVGAVVLTQAEKLYACTPGGSALDRGDGPAVAVDAIVEAHPVTEPAEAQVTADRRRPGPWSADREPARLRAAAGTAVWARTRDRAGNRSPWRPSRVPAFETTVATPETTPFTHGLLCRFPAAPARVGAVNRAWRAAGGRAGNRQRVRPPDSALTWTAYAGQGIHPNWVHAGTELNERLRRGTGTDYRAGVSELVSWSVLDHAPGGTRFRLNESTYVAPDDGHRPPWRDGMGTAVALALLVPAIPPGADLAELRLARLTAQEYLETFFVDWRTGGVLWRDGGPGAWYLEYSYRADARILNGFMQAVVSLARFQRQAERLAGRDPAWAPLAARARERVIAGGQAVSRWLPAYDLGGGDTRYSLLSGAAKTEYRIFHTVLLAQLAQVPYLPESWRARYRAYKRAWGG